MSARTITGGPAMTVAAHGLRVRLPDRWEARLYLRDATAHEGESVSAVLHMANFALPAKRGDFGSGAVEVMSAAHAFVALLEFDAALARSPLFRSHRGVPRPVLRDFTPNALQRSLPGLLGKQTFFTESGRAFCLYAVLGSRTHASRLVREVHAVLANIRIEQR